MADFNVFGEILAETNLDEVGDRIEESLEDVAEEAGITSEALDTAEEAVDNLSGSLGGLSAVADGADDELDDVGDEMQELVAESNAATGSVGSLAAVLEKIDAQDVDLDIKGDKGLELFQKLKKNVENFGDLDDSARGSIVRSITDADGTSLANVVKEISNVDESIDSSAVVKSINDVVQDNLLDGFAEADYNIDNERFLDALTENIEFSGDQNLSGILRNTVRQRNEGTTTPQGLARFLAQSGFTEGGIARSSRAVKEAFLESDVGDLLRKDIERDEPSRRLRKLGETVDEVVGASLPARTEDFPTVERGFEEGAIEDLLSTDISRDEPSRRLSDLDFGIDDAFVGGDEITRKGLPALPLDEGVTGLPATTIEDPESTPDTEKSDVEDVDISRKLQRTSKSLDEMRDSLVQASMGAEQFQEKTSEEMRDAASRMGRSSDVDPDDIPRQAEADVMNFSDGGGEPSGVLRSLISGVRNKGLSESLDEVRNSASQTTTTLGLYVGALGTVAGAAETAEQAVEDFNDELGEGQNIESLNDAISSLLPALRNVSANLGPFNVSLGNLAITIPVLVATIGPLISALLGLAAAVVTVTAAFGALLAVGAIAFIKELKKNFAGINNNMQAIKKIAKAMKNLLVEALAPLKDITIAGVGPKGIFLTMLGDIVRLTEGFAKLTKTILKLDQVEHLLLTVRAAMLGIGNVVSGMSMEDGVTNLVKGLAPILENVIVFLIDKLPEFLSFIGKVAEMIGPSLGVAIHGTITALQDLIIVGARLLKALEGPLRVLFGLITAFTGLLELLGPITTNALLVAGGFLIILSSVIKAVTVLAGLIRTFFLLKNSLIALQVVATGTAGSIETVTIANTKYSASALLAARSTMILVGKLALITAFLSAMVFGIIKIQQQFGTLEAAVVSLAAAFGALATVAIFGLTGIQAALVGTGIGALLVAMGYAILFAMRNWEKLAAIFTSDADQMAKKTRELISLLNILAQTTIGVIGGALAGFIVGGPVGAAIGAGIGGGIGAASGISSSKSIPKAATGGFVEEGGLAMIHSNEFIIPESKLSQLASGINKGVQPRAQMGGGPAGKTVNNEQMTVVNVNVENGDDIDDRDAQRIGRIAQNQMRINQTLQDGR